MTRRRRSGDGEVDALFSKAEEQGFPGALNVLKIMRGGGSVEEDRAIKDKYRRQGLWPDDGKTSRSRSINNEQEVSLLEGIQKYRNTPNGAKPISELQHAPRRGRFGSKKRSWR